MIRCRTSASAFVLAALVVLVLVGCGDDTTDEPAAVSAAAVGTETAHSTSTNGAASATASPSVTQAASVTATASPTTTVEATATSSPTAQPSPTATPSAASPVATATQPPAQPAGQAPGAANVVTALYLDSAAIDAKWPIEAGDTVFSNGVEYFADPTAPQRIMWYPRFSAPGVAAGNTIMAAHVNYVGFGNGPFAYLLDAAVDDSLYLTLGDGTSLAYSVKSVTLYRLAEIDMNPIVFPSLDSHTERVTLISCGGTFIPAASGYGGEYDSRVVLVAERYVP